MTMKRILLVLWTLLWLATSWSPAQPESDVRSRIALLESSSDASLQGWRILAKDIPNGAQPGLDDAGWQALRPGSGFSHKTAWLRQSAIFPEFFAGAKVAGSAVGLVCRFNGLGVFKAVFFVNGQEREAFTLEFGNKRGQVEKTFPLTASARPGEPVLLAFRFENLGKLPLNPRTDAEPGTYLQLPACRQDIAAARETLSQLGRFMTDLKIGASLLDLLPRRPLLPREQRPVAPEYKRLAASKEFQNLRTLFTQALFAFNAGTLRQGEPRALQQELARFYEKVKPVSAFAARRTVFLAGNAHIDLAWLWRWHESVEVSKATFATIMDNMEEYPEIVYVQTQAQAYRWVEEHYPEVFARIQQKVREGRWVIVGGMWAEPDCNLTDGESFVRQILFGKRYFKSKFGVDVTIGWNPDSFGYNWNMPQILSKSGLGSFVTQKISWNDTNVFPYFFFWWEGPDGSRVLTYFPPTGYVGVLTSEEILEGLKLFEENTGFQRTLLLYGLGDHGGGPNREMLNRARELAAGQKIVPVLKHASPEAFLGQFTAKELKPLPVWKDELYLEYHRGTFTTQAETKNLNRKSEVLLANAEKASSLALLFGEHYHQQDLASAWQKVLLNQFHDILPGSSINPVYRDAKELYQQAHREAGKALRLSLDALGRKVDTAAGAAGKPLLVFNSLSWERDGIVALPLPSEFSAGARVLDDAGREVPSQVLAAEKTLVFRAVNVPAGGYRVYKLQAGTPTTAPSPLAVGESSLENEYLAVKLDPRSGDIVSLFDKVNGREVLAPGAAGNALQLFEDIPTEYDAWEIKYTGRQWSLDKADRIQVVEQGPVKAVLRVEKSFLGLSKSRREPTTSFPSSFFTQDVVLWAGVPRIDVEMKADWWEDHVLLKAAFPVDVTSDRATYEIPYAYVQRPTGRETDWDRARYEVPAIRWADLSDGAYGVSLLNENKYGHDIAGHVMRLTLLRSPLDPDPMADRGKHQFSYALYPHKGTWREADTVQKGYEFNVPLLLAWPESHSGELPAALSFYRASPSNIVLSAMKKAEDRDSLVLRLYEAEGTDTEARLEFFRQVKEIYALDLVENRLQALPAGMKTISLKFGKSEIKSIELVF